MIELLKEYIEEIIYEGNKPPKNLKAGSVCYCKIKDCKNNRLKNKADKDKIKVKVKVPDSKGPFSEIMYNKKTYRVLTKSLTKRKWII